MELINTLSYTLAVLGALIVAGALPVIARGMSTNLYRFFVVLALWLILLTMITISGMLIAY